MISLNQFGAAIDVYAACWNEEALLPFFLRHYSFARRIVLLDDHSTDRTRAIAAADPRVELRDSDLGGCLDEDRLRDFKNTAWQGSDADWVIVCDVDELLHHPDLTGELTRLQAAGVTLPTTTGYDLVGIAGLPTDDGKQLYDHITHGVQRDLYSKSVVFNPQAIQEIGYHHGAHHCTPTGRVVRGGNLNVLHCQVLGADYMAWRWERSRQRVHAAAQRNKWKLYDWGEAGIRRFHAEQLALAIPVPGLIAGQPS